MSPTGVFAQRLPLPEPGSDAADALEGQSALEYKLALTPDQVRALRVDLADPESTLVALAERYEVPPAVVGYVKAGRAYRWVGDAADGAGDRPPATAFQLTDAAIAYIRNSAGDVPGSELAAMLGVSESAVSRVTGGSRYGGWRKQSRRGASLALTPKMCDVMLEAFCLGMTATEVGAVIADTLEVKLSKGWMMATLLRPPVSAHARWLALSEGYRAHRAERAAETQAARDALAAQLAAVDAPARGEVPSDVEALMIRALGDGLSPRAICAAAGMPPNRLHSVALRWRGGAAGGSMGRVAAAIQRRQEERDRWLRGVSAKLASALRGQRGRLHSPPPPWRVVCRELFEAARPADFAAGRAA